jgi:hypothetical protein
MALTHSEDWNNENGCTGYETLYRNGMLRMQLAEETSRQLEIDNKLEESQPRNNSWTKTNTNQKSNPGGDQNLGDDVQSFVRWILST